MFVICDEWLEFISFVGVMIVFIKVEPIILQLVFVLFSKFSVYIEWNELFDNTGTLRKYFCLHGTGEAICTILFGGANIFALFARIFLLYVCILEN